MTDALKLRLLKMDLQLITNINEDLLSFLLSAAESAMRREGIEDDGSDDYNAAQIQYAAYLYRKRAASTSGKGGFAPDGGETAMPRFLRFNLNNLLISQKARAGE